MIQQAMHTEVRPPRNQLMFGKADLTYIYFIYGNHHCLSVTTEKEGNPGAVLMWTVEVIEGIELAYQNRKTNSPRNLLNGPGKLTHALNITQEQNGLDLTRKKELFISNSKARDSFEIITTRRIGKVWQGKAVAILHK